MRKGCYRHLTCVITAVIRWYPGGPKAFLAKWLTIKCSPHFQKVKRLMQCNYHCVNWNLTGLHSDYTLNEVKKKTRVLLLTYSQDIRDPGYGEEWPTSKWGGRLSVQPCVQLHPSTPIVLEQYKTGILRHVFNQYENLHFSKKIIISEWCALKSLREQS